MKPKTFEESLAEVRAVAEENNRDTAQRQHPYLELLRLESAANEVAGLSPYTRSEAWAIVEAIVSCRPISEIVPLLTCSHKDL